MELIGYMFYFVIWLIGILTIKLLAQPNNSLIKDYRFCTQSTDANSALMGLINIADLL